MRNCPQCSKPNQKSYYLVDDCRECAIVIKLNYRRPAKKNLLFWFNSIIRGQLILPCYAVLTMIWTVWKYCHLSWLAQLAAPVYTYTYYYWQHFGNTASHCLKCISHGFPGEMEFSPTSSSYPVQSRIAAWAGFGDEWEKTPSLLENHVICISSTATTWYMHHTSFRYQYWLPILITSSCKSYKISPRHPGHSSPHMFNSLLYIYCRERAILLCQYNWEGLMSTSREIHELVVPHAYPRLWFPLNWWLPLVDWPCVLWQIGRCVARTALAN